jgi:hypothetical protein
VDQATRRDRHARRGVRAQADRGAAGDHDAGGAQGPLEPRGRAGRKRAGRRLGHDGAAHLGHAGRGDPVGQAPQARVAQRRVGGADEHEVAVDGARVVRRRRGDGAGLERGVRAEAQEGRPGDQQLLDRRGDPGGVRPGGEELLARLEVLRVGARVRAGGRRTRRRAPPGARRG